MRHSTYHRFSLDLELQTSRSLLDRSRQSTVSRVCFLHSDETSLGEWTSNEVAESRNAMENLQIEGSEDVAYLPRTSHGTKMCMGNLFLTGFGAAGADRQSASGARACTLLLNHRNAIPVWLDLAHAFCFGYSDL